MAPDLVRRRDGGGPTPLGRLAGGRARRGWSTRLANAPMRRVEVAAAHRSIHVPPCQGQGGTRGATSHSSKTRRRCSSRPTPRPARGAAWPPTTSRTRDGTPAESALSPSWSPAWQVPTCSPSLVPPDRGSPRRYGPGSWLHSAVTSCPAARHGPWSLFGPGRTDEGTRAWRTRAGPERRRRLAHQPRQPRRRRQQPAPCRRRPVRGGLDGLSRRRGAPTVPRHPQRVRHRPAVPRHGSTRGARRLPGRGCRARGIPLTAHRRDGVRRTDDARRDPPRRRAPRCGGTAHPRGRARRHARSATPARSPACSPCFPQQ